MSDIDKIDSMDNYNAGKQEKLFSQFNTAIKDLKNIKNPVTSKEFNKNDVLRFVGAILTDISGKKELWRFIDVKNYMFEQIFLGNYKQSKIGSSWKNMLLTLRACSTQDDRLDTICILLEMSNRRVEINSHVCRMFIMLLSETKHSIGKIFDSEPGIYFALAEATKIIMRYYP